MSTKMKGLLKGLRYISQIFDEKEQEMQIGFPTDVKHVAHIGCDGPSTNAPSWMSEFNSPPEFLTRPTNSKEEMKKLSTNPPSEDTGQTEKPKQRSRRSSLGSASSLLNSPDRMSTDSLKHSRHQASSISSSPSNSPRGSDAPKSSRRHRSSNKSMDSRDRSMDSKGESSESSRISRRHKNSSSGAESPAHEQPTIPKHSRGKKSKGSSGSGTSKSSRSKDQNENLDTGSGASESIKGRKNLASQLSSVLEAYEEEG